MRIILPRAVFLLAGAFSVLPCAAQLQWHQETGFRWAQLSPPDNAPPGFTLLVPEPTGLAFTNAADDHVLSAHRVLQNGAGGVAIGDVDNDGWPDVFLPALNGHCKLYKNLGGFKFRDVTAASGIDCSHHTCRGAKEPS